MTELNDKQNEELRLIASELVDSRKWDELPWEKAWAGSYPEKLTTTEIENELILLKQKIYRIQQSGLSDFDFSTTDEHVRTLYLDSSEYFNLYV